MGVVAVILVGIPLASLSGLLLVVTFWRRICRKALVLGRIFLRMRGIEFSADAFSLQSVRNGRIHIRQGPIESLSVTQFSWSTLDLSWSSLLSSFKLGGNPSLRLMVSVLDVTVVLRSRGSSSPQIEQVKQSKPMKSVEYGMQFAVWFLAAVLQSVNFQADNAKVETKIHNLTDDDTTAIVACGHCSLQAEQKTWEKIVIALASERWGLELRFVKGSSQPSSNVLTISSIGAETSIALPRPSWQLHISDVGISIGDVQVNIPPSLQRKKAPMRRDVSGASGGSKAKLRAYKLLVPQQAKLKLGTMCVTVESGLTIGTFKETVSARFAEAELHAAGFISETQSDTQANADFGSPFVALSLQSAEIGMGSPEDPMFFAMTKRFELHLSLDQRTPWDLPTRAHSVICVSQMGMLLRTDALLKAMLSASPSVLRTDTEIETNKDMSSSEAVSMMANNTPAISLVWCVELKIDDNLYLDIAGKASPEVRRVISVQSLHVSLDNSSDTSAATATVAVAQTQVALNTQMIACSVEVATSLRTLANAYRTGSPRHGAHRGAGSAAMPALSVYIQSVDIVYSTCISLPDLSADYQDTGEHGKHSIIDRHAVIQLTVGAMELDKSRAATEIHTAQLQLSCCLIDGQPSWQDLLAFRSLVDEGSDNPRPCLVSARGLHLSLTTPLEAPRKLVLSSDGMTADIDTLVYFTAVQVLHDLKSFSAIIRSNVQSSTPAGSTQLKGRARLAIDVSMKSIMADFRLLQTSTVSIRLQCVSLEPSATITQLSGLELMMNQQRLLSIQHLAISKEDFPNIFARAQEDGPDKQDTLAFRISRSGYFEHFSNSVEQDAIAVAVSIKASRALIRLPDGLQLGTCIRDIQLAVKALSEHRKTWFSSMGLQAAHGRQSQRRDQQNSPRILLSFDLQSLRISAAAPERESWLAAHAPLLAAAGAHSELSAEVFCSDSESLQPRDSGRLASRFYMGLCQDLAVPDPEWDCPADALTVDAETVNAAVIVCPVQSGSSSYEVAHRLVSEVDSVSANVIQSDQRLLFCVLAVGRLSLRLGAIKDPFLSVCSLDAHGPVVMAKHTSKPPQRKSVSVFLHDGIGCKVPVEVNQKHCSPPWKFFTRLQACAGTPEVSLASAIMLLMVLRDVIGYIRSVWQFAWSTAFAPFMLLVTAAFKRVNPAPQSDYGAPSTPLNRVLPWWDRLRYQWRGLLSLTAKNGHLKLAFGHCPNVSSVSHMLICFDDLNADLMPEGKFIIHVDGLEAAGLPDMSGSCRRFLQFPGPLLLASIPCFDIKAQCMFNMPGGLSQDQHYVWPGAGIYSHDAPAEMQGPVDLVELFRSLGMQLNLTFALGTPTRCSKSMDSGHSSSASPVIHFGERQVLWMRNFISSARRVPRYISQVSRMRRFGHPPRPRDASAKPIPKLLDSITIEASGTPVIVKLSPNAPGDPCANLLLQVDSIQLGMSLKRKSLSIQTASGSAVANANPPPWVTSRLKVTISNAGLLVSSMQEETLSSDVESVRPSLSKEAVIRNILADSISPGSPLSTGSAAKYPSEGGFALTIVSLTILKETPSHALETTGKPFPPTPLTVDVEDVKAYITRRILDSILCAVEQAGGGFGAIPQLQKIYSAEGTAESGDADVASSSDQIAESVPASETDEQWVELQRRMERCRSSDVGESSFAGTDGTGTVSSEDLMDRLLSKSQSFDMQDRIMSPTAASSDGTPEGGHVRYLIMVSCVQVIVHSKSRNGQLLLCSSNAHVGSSNFSSEILSNAGRKPDKTQTVLRLDQVQGYIVQTDVDPNAELQWLAIEHGQLVPPKSSLVRRVFDPADMHLHMTRRKMSGVDQGVTLPQQLDIRFHADELNVALSSREFSIIMDCISCIILAATPNRTSLLSCERHLLSDATSQLESQKQSGLSRRVAARRAGLVQLRRYVAHLQAGSDTVAANATAAQGVIDATSSTPEALLSEINSDGPARLLNILVNGRKLSEHGSSFWQAQLAFAALAEHLVSEAEDRMRKQEAKLNALVSEAKSRLERSKQGEGTPVMLGLQVGRVAVALLQEGDKPWVTVRLEGIAFERSTYSDRSGVFRATIRSTVVLDAEGQLPATEGTDAGVILCHWNPTLQWAEQPTILVVANHKSQSLGQQFVVQNLDLSLHPLSCHLTQKLASGLNEYFDIAYARDKSEAKAAQKMHFAYTLTSNLLQGSRNLRRMAVGGSSSTFSLQSFTMGMGQKSSASKKSDSVKSPRQQTKAYGASPFFRSRLSTTRNTLDGSNHMYGAASAASTPAKGPLTTAEQSEDSGSPDATPSSHYEPLKTGRHRRTQSDGTAPGTKAALSEQSGQQDGVFFLAATLKGISGQSSASRNSDDDKGELSEQSSDEDEDKSEAAEVDSRIRFAHVRFNQANFLITFVGSPVSVKDLSIVLDTRVYNNIIGQWPDLVGRIKWDAVKSILKSLAGLQRAKIRDIKLGIAGISGVDCDAAEAEMELGSSMSDASSVSESADGDAIQDASQQGTDSKISRLQRWGKVFGRRRGGADESTAEAMDPAAISEEEKKRLLLGLK